jgi:hypothetical protein
VSNSAFARKEGIRTLVPGRMRGKYDRSRGLVGPARMAARPVGFEDERFNAGTCGRQVDLGHGDAAMTQTVAHDGRAVFTLNRTLRRHQLGIIQNSA